MPGDPKDCRAHGARCGELAAETEDPQLRRRLEKLAVSWAKLATDLERAETRRNVLTARASNKPI